MRAVVSRNAIRRTARALAWVKMRARGRATSTPKRRHSAPHCRSATSPERAGRSRLPRGRPCRARSGARRIRAAGATLRGDPPARLARRHRRSDQREFHGPRRASVQRARASAFRHADCATWRFVVRGRHRSAERNVPRRTRRACRAHRRLQRLRPSVLRKFCWALRA